MSSSEVDPIAQIADRIEQAERLAPPFGAIAIIALHEVNVANAQFTELARTTDRPLVPEEISVNQQFVDSLVSEILNRPIDSQLEQNAALLDDLTLGTIRTTHTDTGAQTQLLNSTLASVHARFPRSEARKILGAHSTKANKLAEYFYTLDVSEDKSLLNTVSEKVAKSILDLKKSPDPANLETYSIEQLENLILSSHTIDTETDLSQLRLACAATIFDCLKYPDFQSSLKTVLSSENTGLIDSPNFFAFYFTCQIIDDLQSEDIKTNYELINFLDLDAEHRTIVPFLKKKGAKQYKAQCERLRAACYAYVDLMNSEKWLRSIREREDTLEGMRDSAVATMAGRTALRSSGVIAECSQKIKDEIARKTGEDAEDNAPEEHVWAQAIEAENLISDSAQDLVETITRQRLKLNKEAKTALRSSAEKPIEAEYNRMKFERDQARVQPVIDQLMHQLSDIDQHYILSGKKMRERNPRLISLSRDLSDALTNTDHEPLDQDTARSLAGLMLGVYWERTGQEQPLDEIIQNYLDDANELRSLSSKLEELGHSTSSNLLRSINLLDEMIDSGIFDSIEDKPEFEELKEFILAYIFTRDAKPQEELAVDKTADVPEPIAIDREDLNKEKPTTLSTLPIEVVGEAEDEDIYVFPPGASWREVVSEFSQHVEIDDRYTVQWDRIIKLVELRDHCQKQGLEIDFIRTKHASWQKLPFFVLEVKMPGSSQAIAVVESPVYGNATYIFRESEDRLEWRDAVQLTRHEARELGAVPAVHVDDKRLDLHKEKLWDRIISELTVFK